MPKRRRLEKKRSSFLPKEVLRNIFDFLFALTWTPGNAQDWNQFALAHPSLHPRHFILTFKGHYLYRGETRPNYVEMYKALFSFEALKRLHFDLQGLPCFVLPPRVKYLHVRHLTKAFGAADALIALTLEHSILLHLSHLPRLRRLSFDYCLKLDQVDLNSLPCLEDLSLTTCTLLRRITFPPSLTSLEILECPYLSFDAPVNLPLLSALTADGPGSFCMRDFRFCSSLTSLDIQFCLLYRCGLAAHLGELGHRNVARLPLLTELKLNGEARQKDVLFLGDFKGLQSLELAYMHSIANLSFLNPLTNVKALVVRKMNALQNLPCWPRPCEVTIDSCEALLAEWRLRRKIGGAESFVYDHRDWVLSE